MKCLKGLALLSVLAAPLSPLATSAWAQTATDTKAAADTKSMADAKPAMSDADKRAKASDCSRQADAQKLHGEKRKQFREACKRK